MTDRFILLVEDNGDDEALSIRALKKNGIKNDVVVMRDGVEAVQFLFGEGGASGGCGWHLPTVVFLDLKLPRLNGLEVLRQIRENNRTRMLPVVVLTSSIEKSDLLESYGLGVNSYLRKPVDFDEFSQAVQQIGRYWLELNQAPPALQEHA
jgi:two-component system, response regulator